MLRAHSIGSKYNLEFRCEDCGTKNTVEKIIPDDFEVKEKQPGDSFVFSATLPVSKFDVELRLLTGEDEEILYKKGVKNEEDRLEDRLAFQIVQIRKGKKVIAEDYPTKKRIISDLPYVDMNHLDDVISKHEFGLKTVYVDECSNCYAQNEVMLSFNQNFFRHKSRK
jgi:hypothetical protein